MSSNQNFLVAFDFRPESEAALDYAIALGRQNKADIHLLYVLEEESSMLKMVLTDTQRKMIQHGARDNLKDIVKQKSADRSLKLFPVIKKGKVYNRIVETATELGSSLIFMGRTDSKNIVKNFTGTNTMHIVRESDIPAITLKKMPKNPGCEHLLLPLDLTKQTKKQVCKAIDIANLFKSDITILTVLTEDLVSLEIKFRTRLREIKDIFESMQISCDYKLIPDPDPVWSRLLNKLSLELHTDLVIIMTQQELDFTEYFIGSTAQEIINNSDLPVLSLTPEEEGPSILTDDMLKALVNPIKIFDH
jgi:nucleotide-binding universal stress UspA family protein